MLCPVVFHSSSSLFPYMRSNARPLSVHQTYVIYSPQGPLQYILVYSPPHSIAHLCLPTHRGNQSFYLSEKSSCNKSPVKEVCHERWLSYLVSRSLCTVGFLFWASCSAASRVAACSLLGLIIYLSVLNCLSLW